MTNEHDTQAESREWCCGFPCIGRFPLEARDIAELEHKRKKSLWIGLLLTFVLPVIVVVYLVIIPTLAPNASRNDFLLLGIVEAIFLTIGLVCAGVNNLQRAKLIRLDLKDSYLLRFAGIVTPESQEFLEFKKLNKKYPAKEVTFDILPISSRVYRFNDKHIKKWVPLERTTVANTPEIAIIAANWLDKAEENEDGVLAYGKRELNDVEKDELLKFARSQWQKSILGAISFGAFATLKTVGYFTDGKIPSGFGLFFYIIVILMAATSIIALIDGVKMAIRIKKDIQLEYIAIIRAKSFTSIADIKTESEDATDEADVNTYEVLPFSNLIWTVNGLPSNWRKTKLLLPGK